MYVYQHHWRSSRQQKSATPAADFFTAGHQQHQHVSWESYKLLSGRHHVYKESDEKGVNDMSNFFGDAIDVIPLLVSALFRFPVALLLRFRMVSSRRCRAHLVITLPHGLYRIGDYYRSRDSKGKRREGGGGLYEGSKIISFIMSLMHARFVVLFITRLSMTSLFR